MSTPVVDPPADLEHSIEEADLKHRPGCIKGCILGQHHETGNLILVPLCCKNWNCPACAVKLKARWMDVAVRGQPERFVTLTGDPKLHHDPKEMRIAIKNAWAKFVAHWRRGRAEKGNKHRIPPHTLEYIQVWELHKSGYPHLHVLVRGEYIPQAYLRQWMITAGVGEIVHVRAVEHARAAAAEVLKYVTKAAQDVSGTFEGARLITTSRNYDEHALPAPNDDNTAGYEWIRLKRSNDDVYDYLVDVCGYTPLEGSLPHRLELVAGKIAYHLYDLYMALCPLTDFTR